jgi:hypothetical protein
MIYVKLIILIVVAIIWGCSRENSLMNENISVIQDAPAEKLPVENLRKEYVDEQGWKIPKMGKPLKSDVTNLVDDQGKTISLTTIDFTSREPITKEPFDSIGVSSNGFTKIELIIEMKFKERVLGYMVFAKKVSVDSKNNSVTDVNERSFYYRYFDYDGDGKFETLVTDSSKIRSLK